jgi:hypothetical protein
LEPNSELFSEMIEIRISLIVRLVLAIVEANKILKKSVMEQVRKEQLNNNPKECINSSGEEK